MFHRNYRSSIKSPMSVQLSAKKAAFLTDLTRERARLLLRALLRQATYLPDAAARGFIHHHVLGRYREYPETEPRLTHKRFETLLHNGERGLRVLERANNGELKPLIKVLEWTYGRTGKRRHELMKPLTQKNAPSEADDGEPSQASSKPLIPHKALDAPRTFREDHLLFEISSNYSIVKALVQSQWLHHKALPRHREIKSTALKMPAKNIWHRPMPQRRRKNAAKKWWAQALRTVLPPLPETEWLHLRDLSCGKTRWDGPPPRRKPLAPSTRNMPIHDVQKITKAYKSHSSMIDYDSPFAPYVEDGVATGKRQPLRHRNSSEDHHIGQFLEDGLRLRRLNKKLPNGLGGAHAITPRFMRRVWQAILAQCPLVTWDASKSKWNVHWFREQSRSSDTQHTRTSPQDDEDQSTTDRLVVLFGAATGAKAHMRIGSNLKEQQGIDHQLPEPP